MEEKQFKKLIITGSTIALIVVFMVLSFTTVPANNVGIKYSKFGGTQQGTLNEGVHFKIPFIEKIYKLDTTVQERSIDDIQIQTKDGERITFSINVKYYVNKENAVWVYQRYGGLSELNENIIRNDTESAMRDVVATYDATYVLSDGTPQITKEIEENLQERLSHEGVDLRGVTIKRNDASPEYMERLEDLKNSQNKVKTQEQERLASEIEAEKKLIQAKGDAEANAVMTEKLSDQVLRKMLIDKWNGELPKVQGANGSFFDYSKLIEE